jgi:transposase-like protein
VRDQYDSEWAATASVAAKFGIGTLETLSKWLRKARSTQAARPGVTSDTSA